MRLYYDDAYTREFSARITGRLTENGHPAVILDRTYFYPTSGGQPNDTGTINDVPVIDVIARREDGEVVHVLERELSSDDAVAMLHWERRFDHMQHHTGQHILSQA
ncbi:MAG TPA: alanine--tRNA ligase-related protein, partial [Phototrophicaceae bacterium]|nr:alanine--tRNA ligase-related protein [Phototrophicaceae bacterium]